ncbi:hypothetical protein ABE244_25670 [Bacillus toyonensis]|uniref:hypothetical protein n=1 Tax=Bacillus toyonensis TaxID=155322 RepID=UPI003D2105AB
MKEFVKTTFPLRIGDAQFFAKKPNPEEPEDDDPEEPEEPETKPNGKESRPTWVNEILEAIKPQAGTGQSKQQVPVPEAPQPEEEPEEEEVPQQEQPKKKSLLSWLW